MRKGCVYWVDLGGSSGHEQHYRRPVIIVQDDLLNDVASTTVIVPCTSNMETATLKTSVKINTDDLQISGNTVALCHQVRVIDQNRIEESNCVGCLGAHQINSIDETIKVVFGLLG